MSISQLLQPNQYTLYGNFQASISGTEEDALLVLYGTTQTVNPTYAYNKVSYSVFGSCVSFQATIELLTRGAGSGEVSVKLPDSMPQAYWNLDNPQMCQLFFEPASPGDYKEWWGEFVDSRKINLWRRQNDAGGTIDILDFSEVTDTSPIKLTGVYFTQ